MGKTIRGRFAPSPSGRMHLGNLFSALLAWLDIRAVGGILVLRMEDLDPRRCRGEYAVRLADDLTWLGLDWDEGYGKGGPDGPYLQSQRTHLYHRAFQALGEQGLLYPCWCTRAERLVACAPHADETETLCPCRRLTGAERRARTAEHPPAWRVAVPHRTMAFVDGHFGAQALGLSTEGDFLLRRSDGVYAYQLAVTADDGQMGIDHVVRGRDLLDSTARQLWLLERMGYPAPEYAHVPLLLAPDGRRLSKREKDLDMGTLRGRFAPEELVGFLGFLAGLLRAPEPISPRDLAGVFHWSLIPHENISVYEALAPQLLY